MPSVLHILTDDRGLDTFPSVYNALCLWKKQGWDNDIATAGDCSDFNQFIDTVHPLNPTIFLLPTAWGLSHIEKHYDLIITYDPKDLESVYIARLLSGRKLGKKHLHHSLEIPSYAFESKDLFRLIHRLLLRKALSDIDLLAIQDRFRYKILCDYFPDIVNKPFSIVPNSYLDVIEPMAEKLSWFDEVRKDADALILYIGGIERWALSNELLDEIATLPMYTFLFSGWSRDGYYDELVKKYARHGHMVFDIKKKSLADLNYMVSQSDIGMAIYDCSDCNCFNMGLSSGKFFKYIQHNKPLIINDIPFLNKLVTQNGMGAVYSRGNLGRNISFIMQSGEYTQSFRNKLGYEPFYKNTIKQVIKLVGES
ncbi:MAG: hypothetical protein A2X82_16275 [Geobacteraceae bacterium GWC2_55_20]|nr:MAG: hypothetical protein A2X82_16275 [Geobacteraceae bacterium GWC2_55_20]OGU23160.1 MAG: hypothetical protein A2X85_13395 [Geobacteraceae bacterium GWF2_54_21]HBA73033.1 hypothetical protein [Geobacter sp.]